MIKRIIESERFTNIMLWACAVAFVIAVIGLFVVLPFLVIKG